MTTPARASKPLGWSAVVGAYRATALWKQCIPIHPGGSKSPYPRARTGREQKAMIGTTDWYIEDYGEKFGVGKMKRAAIGLVLPQGVVGIDFDCYDGKRGAATRAAWERMFGPLPQTASIRARGDGSGIWLYRMTTEGLDLRTDLGRASGVEVICWYQRYCVAPPGLHHATGRPREWWDRDGLPTGWPWIPGLADLAALPKVWADALVKPPAKARPRAAQVDDRTGGRLLAPHARRVLRAPEGERNKQLFLATCFAVRNGVAPDLAEQVLSAAGEQAGLEPDEIAKTIASGITAGLTASA